MTIDYGPSEKEYIPDGITTAFPTVFEFINATDIDVILDGETLSSGFSVSGGNYATGTVTFAVAPSGTRLRLVRNTVMNQTLTEEANPDAADYVNGFDKTIMIAQDLERRLLRSIQLNPGEETADFYLPDLDARKNKFLAFDSNGDLTFASAASEAGGPATTWGQELLGKSTAAAGRDHLELGTGAVLDTGTGAGEVPTNADLGTAAQLDTGTTEGTIPVLGPGGDLPAVNGRNLTNVRSFTTLAEVTLASSGAMISSQAITELASYENYIFELHGVCVSADNNGLLMELYIDATLIGAAGVTGKMFQYINWGSSGVTDPQGELGGDSFVITPVNWLGADPSYISCSILFQNSKATFPTSDRDYQKWPSWTYLNSRGIVDNTDYEFSLIAGSGHCKVDGQLTGFRLFTENEASVYFDKGFIRVIGFNGPAFT